MHAFARALLVSLVLAGAAQSALAAKCLFISSYHRGYAWSDGVERGLRSVLEGRCELRQFDMDTKRNKSSGYLHAIAGEARTLIEGWGPDVVITADDNAVKYLVVPYYRDATLPFVFSGVNWTTEEYDFPYTNVTGMIEVAPIKPMLVAAAKITAPGRRALYLGANTLTERKNLARIEGAAAELGLELDSRLVDSAGEWIAAYRGAQTDRDFLILGSHSGINDWEASRDRVLAALGSGSRRLTVTNHGWMMPFSMLGMTKVPEEHGEWSARAAIAILDGVAPGEIPIVSNRQWDLWMNEGLLRSAGVDLPQSLRHRAKRVRN